MTTEQKQLLKSRLRAQRWTLGALAEQSHITQGYLSSIIYYRATAHQVVRTMLALTATQLTEYPYTAEDFAPTNGDE
jgi:hypothetical protein